MLSVGQAGTCERVPSAECLEREARRASLIRRWWHDQHNARGRIVWEYDLEGFYADAIWFPNAPVNGAEEPGKGTARLFPLAGERIALCEAKATLTPEHVGQALVYSGFARRAGAELAEKTVFSQSHRRCKKWRVVLASLSLWRRWSPYRESLSHVSSGKNGFASGKNLARHKPHSTSDSLTGNDDLRKEFLRAESLESIGSQ